MSVFNKLETQKVTAISHLPKITNFLCQAADPYREHFATGEAWRLKHPEFDPKLCFYAFDTTVEHVEVSVQTTLLKLFLPESQPQQT